MTSSEGIGSQLLIIIVLIIANGLFSMTEMAIVSSRKAKLETLSEEGHKGAHAALLLTENPNKMLSTIQIGITVISIITGLYGGANFSEPLANFLKSHIPSLANYADALSPIVIVTLITYLSLIIGELVPKRIAMNNPEKIATLMARPIRLFSIFMTPFVSFLSLSTTFLMKILGIKNKEGDPVTEEEIKIMLTEGAAKGIYEEEEPEMVDNVFRLADLDASDIMTPRTQIEWIDINAPEEEIRAVLKNATHQRLPVGDDSLDEIIGIIQLSDIFTKQLAYQNRSDLKDLIQESYKKPFMVPESISLTKLIKVFRTEGIHEAIVLDEFGGISGLVTLSDIIEEIVGWIPSGEEERKEEESRIIERDENSWYVDGLLTLDEFRDYFLLEVIFPEEGEGLYKTLGGYITYSIGKIPKEGDAVTFGPFTFEVADMDRNRVDKILLTRLSIQEELIEMAPE